MNDIDLSIKKTSLFTFRISVIGGISLIAIIITAAFMIVGGINLIDGLYSYQPISFDRAIKLADKHCSSSDPGFISYDASGINVNDPLAMPGSTKKPALQIWLGDDETEGFGDDSLEVDAIWIVHETLKIIEYENRQPDTFNRFVGLSTGGNCKWALYDIPAHLFQSLGHSFSSALYMSRQLSSAVLNHGDNHESYGALRLWRGGHIIVFENSVVEDTPYLSIWFPKTSVSIFIRDSIVPVLAWWTVLVLAWWTVFAWCAIRPLGTLELTVRNACGIIRENKNIPVSLDNCSKNLTSRNVALTDMKYLLHDMSSMIFEREKWMGGILHHLKNDLQVIVFGLDKLKRTLDAMPTCKNGNMTESRDSPLMAIEKSTDRIRGVLNNVAIYQQIRFGSREQPTKLDLNSMLDTIINDIEDAGGKIARKGLRVVDIEAKEMALHSALKNLIWNAYRHGDGEMIEIKTRLVDIFAKVEIIIDDEGPGIDEKDIEELFKPYRQGKTRQNSIKEIQGAGLGLAIAKEAVEEHGGKISIENRMNSKKDIVGLRVRVVLPLSQT